MFITSALRFIIRSKFSVNYFPGRLFSVKTFSIDEIIVYKKKEQQINVQNRRDFTSFGKRTNSH
jgi:hypothetical protein